MTSLVVDTSVALKWYVREQDSESAHRILAAPRELCAPRLLRMELANALWKNWRKKIVSAVQVGEAMSSIDRTINIWREDDRLFDSALSLSMSLDHSVYDCIYLALALELGVPLVTTDKALLAAAPPGSAIALADWRA